MDVKEEAKQLRDFVRATEQEMKKMNAKYKDLQSAVDRAKAAADVLNPKLPRTGKATTKRRKAKARKRSH